MLNIVRQKLALLFPRSINYQVDRLLLLRYLAKSLPKKAHIIDVGAGTGSTARFIMELGKISGENIHLIEAVPETFASMAINNADLNCHNYAVASKSGTVSIFSADSTNPLAWKSATLYKGPITEKFGRSHVKERIVPAINLNEFYQMHGLHYVDLLMLNCEGAEYEIFDGDINFLKSTRLVWIEIHGRARAFLKFKSKRVELYDLFEKLGFTRVAGHQRHHLTASNDHMTHLWERI